MFQSASDPFELFGLWFSDARETEPSDPNAMAVATVDERGAPRVRILLLKGFDSTGFSFFTNLESAKARELRANPQVALCFHWKSRARQVRIEGDTEPVTPAESDAYFATRSRDSQIGAWASQQSRPLDDRATLEARVAEFNHRFADQPVPRPIHWGGVRLVPRYFEFWQDRPHRLHDRITFVREGGVWRRERLYP